jgi:hypothetical protein
MLIVSLNNVILEPLQDFVISNNNIIFTNAPDIGDDVFIIALQQLQTLPEPSIMLLIVVQYQCYRETKDL